MRFRKIHLLAIPAILIAMFLVAEVVYRWNFRHQVGNVFKGVQQAHSSEGACVINLYRFEDSVDEVQTSLFEDLWETGLYRARRWSPIKSRLFSEGAYRGSTSYASAYIMMVDEQPKLDFTFHGFVWSPRRWRFVNVPWGRCDRPGCPAKDEAWTPQRRLPPLVP